MRIRFLIGKAQICPSWGPDGERRSWSIQAWLWKTLIQGRFRQQSTWLSGAWLDSRPESLVNWSWNRRIRNMDQGPKQKLGIFPFERNTPDEDIDNWVTTKWMHWLVQGPERAPRRDGTGGTRWETVERTSHMGVNLVMINIQCSQLILSICQVAFQMLWHITSFDFSK